MLIEELERAEAKTYFYQFHQADKRVAILEEKLKRQTVIEIMFGFGVGAGSALIGAAPSFWDPHNIHGQVALTIGIVLLGGNVVAKIYGSTA